MNFFFALLFFAVGFFFGWCARSFQFFVDEECANPDHKDKDQ